MGDFSIFFEIFWKFLEAKFRKSIFYSKEFLKTVKWHLCDRTIAADKIERVSLSLSLPPFLSLLSLLVKLT